MMRKLVDISVVAMFMALMLYATLGFFDLLEP